VPENTLGLQISIGRQTSSKAENLYGPDLSFSSANYTQELALPDFNDFIDIDSYRNQ
jgi:hypothetical protein